MSLPQPSTASTAAWYSRLVNRKFLLRCLLILVLVHIMEVSAIGIILRSTDIPRLTFYLGFLVIQSLFLLLLGMYSGDTLVYRSLYHAGHILAITCGYMGLRFRVPPDTPVSTMSWLMSTLFAVYFFVLACVMNGVYNTATGTTGLGGMIPRPLLTLFQMHAAPDAEETHEMCNRKAGNHSIRQSAFSHQAQRRPSFNEETRALLCPSPVEGKSEENLNELV